jgi:hypothetical protein
MPLATGSAGARRPQPALRLRHHRRPPGRKPWGRDGPLRPPRRTVALRGGPSNLVPERQEF